MSNSRKHTPIHGITVCESEKKDKRIANRQYRRRTKVKVNKLDEIMPEIREISDVWSFGKDGKTYKKNISDKDLRK